MDERQVASIVKIYHGKLTIFVNNKVNAASATGKSAKDRQKELEDFVRAAFKEFLGTKEFVYDCGDDPELMVEVAAQLYYSFYAGTMEQWRIVARKGLKTIK